jgi:hypothetical protein
MNSRWNCKCSIKISMLLAGTFVLPLSPGYAQITVPVVSEAAAASRSVAEADGDLQCTALQVSVPQINLPSLDTTVTLTVQNNAASAITLVRPSLGFAVPSAPGKWRDVTSAIYVEPDVANSWFITPGQTVQLKFKVQFLHDTPQGKLRIQPRVEYFLQTDNLFPELVQFSDKPVSSVQGAEKSGAAESETKELGQWQVENPAAAFNASATLVKQDVLPPGAASVVQLAVQANRIKGLINLRSPKAPIRPNAEYVSGLFYKSDRTGWDSPINKGAAVVEYHDRGAARAHEMHLFEIPSWTWELARFKSGAKTTQADMAVWNRGWAPAQSGQSWYSAAFLVPRNKLRVLNVVTTADMGTPPANTTGETVLDVSFPASSAVKTTAENAEATTSEAAKEASVEGTPAQEANATESSPSIIFLGDDRPKPGEGGDWNGRYGGKSFILPAMQAPRDVVGGRFLPQRRWAQGKSGFAPTAPVWTEKQGDFFYEVLTGDPNEQARHWIPINDLTPKDPRALVNPLEGGRRYSSWDDRGEVRPFDGTGPDLIVNLEIPKGLHRLTLYFIDWDFWDKSRPRTHRIFFSDGNKDEKSGYLSSGYISDFGPGLYKVYGVNGPSKLRLRIQKDKSVCAVLSGIFLDDLELPDAASALPKRGSGTLSAPLQEAVKSYTALREMSQQSPEKFLLASDSMKTLLRQANSALEAAGKNANDEIAVAEWLRWQSVSSLVVAPWVREPAFARYLALRPPTTVPQAKTQTEAFLAQGRLGEAKQVAALWLQIAQQNEARQGTAPQRLPNSARESIWELLEDFAARDADYAGTLALQWVRLLKAQNEKPDVALAVADQMMGEARKASVGELPTRIGFRTAVALYDAVESVYGSAGLGDEGSYRRAEAIAGRPDYLKSASRQGIIAYQDYLKRWPNGEHAHMARFAIVYIGCSLGGTKVPEARTYSAMSAVAARELLALADLNTGKALGDVEAKNRAQSPTEVGLKEGAGINNLTPISLRENDTSLPPKSMMAYPSFEVAATEAAWRMGQYYMSIGDKEEAKAWFGELVSRAPLSERGQQASEALKGI